MKRGVGIAMVGILGMQLLWGAEGVLLIEEGSSPQALQQARRQLEGVLAVDRSLTKDLKRIPPIQVKKSGKRYLLEWGPLPEEKALPELARRLHRIFPHAQWIRIEKEKVKVPVPLAATAPVALSEGGDRGNEKLWIALFALAMTGVLGLFVSSRKIEKLRKEQEKIRSRHKEMEEQFNEVFSHMGQNIYKLGKEIVDATSDVVEKIGEPEIGSKLRQMINKETKILDTTSTLLEFLRIKGGKVTYDTEPFNLNRVLDEVLGNLGSRVQSSEDVELIFHIDKQFPRDVEGDFTHLADSLTHLLEHAVVQSGEGEVSLYAGLSKKALGRYKHALQFRIEYRTPPEREESASEYFRPVYDEESGEYFRLECFIAKELIEIMEGEIRVQADENRMSVAVVIPVEMDEKERRRYRLRSLELTDKSVLVVNRNSRASEAIAGLFSYFRHRAEVMELSEYENRRPPLVKYDILVVEESLVDPMLIEYTKKIRRHRDLKVVSVRNIFSPAEAHFDESKVDARLVKPLTLERVYQLIEELYPPLSVEHASTQEKKDTRQEIEKQPSREFWRGIPQTPGVDLGSFSEFAGASLLIVEDNEINRKMLLKVLEHSGMKLSTAVHGLEALEAVQNGEKFDLILMDINMPVMDGYTATEKIRRLPMGEQLPIIALSALQVENELERMIQSGLDGYIPKPLNIGQLYTVFDRYLRRSVEKGKTQTRKREIRYPEAIDLHKALEHAGENELLLQELLREFVELYGESDKKFHALYEKGDLEGLRHELVDLLGLSGTIGAQDLYVAVKELYKVLLLNKLEMVPSCIVAYSEALKSLNDSIRDYLDSLREDVPEG